MELTEEQKERIRRNRERALATQKRKKEEQRALGVGNGLEEERKSAVESSEKRPRLEKEAKDEEEDVELEDFEVGASPFVSKREAMQTYCLPEGTLAVCAFVEKENPRNKAWASLKLYKRTEIRRRAMARFGGLEGLVRERRKREERRFRKDMKTAGDIFK